MVDQGIDCLNGHEFRAVDQILRRAPKRALLRNEISKLLLIDLLAIKRHRIAREDTQAKYQVQEDCGRHRYRHGRADPWLKPLGSCSELFGKDVSGYAQGKGYPQAKNLT